MEKTGNMRKNLKNSGSNMANTRDRLERDAEVDFGRRAVDFQEMGNFLTFLSLFLGRKEGGVREVPVYEGKIIMPSYNYLYGMLRRPINKY